MKSALAGSHHRSAPESRPGTWTLALASASVVGVVLLAISLATGLVESAADFTDNWLLTGWGVAILATGASSVIAGAFAIIRRHDRGWIVPIAALLGLLMTVLMLHEVAQGLSP